MHQTQITTKSIHRPELLGCASLLAILVAADGARAQDITPVPPVSVTAPAPAPLMDGSAAAGYRVDTSTAAGPIWDDLPVQDTPYSISVIPLPLIENVQGSQLSDVFKLIPQITSAISAPTDNGQESFKVRGFAAGVNVEGLNGITGGNFPFIEDKENVELLSGASGFLYGLSNSFGTVNTNFKRPTAAPYYSVTAGDNTGANAYIHGDFGGPLNFSGLTDGLFGYRLNLVEQGGGTSVQNMSIAHNLVSGAIDVHPWEGLLVQFNASRGYFHENGNTIAGGSNYNTNTVSNGQPYVPYPAAGNPQNGEPPWAYQNTEYTTNAGAKVTWKPNEIFTLRTEYQYQRDAFFAGPALFDYINLDSTASEYGFCCNAYGTNYTNSGYSFIDAKFSTFGLEHKVTAGFSGDTSITNYPAYQAQFVSGVFPFLGTNNFYSGIPYIPEPDIKYVSRTPGETGKVYNENFILGDEIKAFGDKLILFGGMNYTITGTQSLVAGNSSDGSGPFSALTPTGSIVYKLLSWLSAYATYQEGLQGGTLVTNNPAASPPLIYTNVGTVIPAYVTHSIEGGLKATIGTNLLLTASIYNMDQPNNYAKNNNNGTYTFEVAGSNVHKGIEVTAVGKLTSEITLIGGFNAMDARVVSNLGAPATDGSMPTGTSPFSGNLYMEYSIPYYESFGFLKGLTLIGGFQAQSWFYIDLPNQTRIPGHIVGDLGFRYETKLYDHPLTIRFNVNNITNAGYWLNFGGAEGPPRTFLATAELKW